MSDDSSSPNEDTNDHGEDVEEVPLTPLWNHESPQRENNHNHSNKDNPLTTTLFSSFRTSTLKLVTSLSGTDDDHDGNEEHGDPEGGNNTAAAPTQAEPETDIHTHTNNDADGTNNNSRTHATMSPSTVQTPTATNVTQFTLSAGHMDHDIDRTTNTDTTKKTRMDVSTSSTNEQQQQQQSQQSQPPANKKKKKNKLYKSNRLKGYMTLILASIINFIASQRSATAVNSNTVRSTLSQRQYAEAVSMTSFLISLLILLAHLDQWSPLQRVWSKFFGDHHQSYVEIGLLLFLVVWWTVATGIQTSVRGICGDGKAQYNLYFSTWCCCWTCYWTLERWLVAHGWASFKAFISSWPFRAPGWIAISFFSLLTMIWYVDLMLNHTETESYIILRQHYDNIDDSQWQWLLFVGPCTIVPAFCFVLVELFRETRKEALLPEQPSPPLDGGGDEEKPTITPVHQRPVQVLAAMVSMQDVRNPINDKDVDPSPGNSPNGQHRRRPTVLPQHTPTARRSADPNDDGLQHLGKGPCENFLEGLCLTALVILWIPTVIVATTPGGAASLIGNAYFFTWVTTVFVMETSIWFVHDLRKRVHSSLRVKEQEYVQQQMAVLEASQALEGKRRKLRQQQSAAKSARLGKDQLNHNISTTITNTDITETEVTTTRFGQPSVGAMMLLTNGRVGASGVTARPSDDESSVGSALAAARRRKVVRSGALNSLVHVASATPTPRYELSERLDGLDVMMDDTVKNVITDEMLRALDLDLDTADADTNRRSTVWIGDNSNQASV